MASNSGRKARRVVQKKPPVHEVQKPRPPHHPHILIERRLPRPRMVQHAVGKDKSNDRSANGNRNASASANRTGKPCCRQILGRRYDFAEVDRRHRRRPQAGQSHRIPPRTAPQIEHGPPHDFLVDDLCREPPLEQLPALLSEHPRVVAEPQVRIQVRSLLLDGTSGACHTFALVRLPSAGRIAIAVHAVAHSHPQRNQTTQMHARNGTGSLCVNPAYGSQGYKNRYTSWRRRRSL